MKTIIGLSGGSASGKTSIANKIVSSLVSGEGAICHITMDSFYVPLTPEQIKLANDNNWNFDAPECFDYDLIYKILSDLKQGKDVNIPVYCYKSHSRLENTTNYISGSNRVVIFEGLYAFYNQKIRDLIDLKIFVDCDSDVRLSRRILRDISERGRDVIGVLKQYARFVKPMFDDYVYPTSKYSDIILPRGLDNLAAMSLLLMHISQKMNGDSSPN